MIDTLLHMTLSNICLALIPAIAAFLVQRKGSHPQLAHILWLFVFVKLVTPPVIDLPVVPHLTEQAVAATADPITNVKNLAVDFPARGNTPAVHTGFDWTLKSSLLLLWLTGSLVIGIWSAARVVKFNRLLRDASKPASSILQSMTNDMAKRLGMKTSPRAFTTEARLTPMVWWVGGDIRIIIPSILLDRMKAQEFQWVLAHELAHVRRRDYLVRWLEWPVSIFFWWNPLVWWAKSNLRINEELCCDSLVVAGLQPKSRTYAASLLEAIECLAAPLIRPPAMASQMSSGGQLERRFRMIVSGKLNRKTSKHFQMIALLCAAVVLPLGLAYTQTENQSTETRYREMGVSGETVSKIRAHFQMEGFSEEQTEAALTGMLGVVKQFRTPDTSDRIEGEMLTYFETRIGLSKEQIGVVHDVARRLTKGMGSRTGFTKLGISDHAVNDLQTALAENGLNEEQIGPAMNGILKLIAMGPDRELDPRMHTWFEETVGLDEDQIDLIREYAAALSADMTPANRLRIHGVDKKKQAAIENILRKNGLSDDQIQPTLNSLVAAVQQIHRLAEDEEPVMDRELYDQLAEEVQLTDEQIELVHFLARRIARGGDKTEKPVISKETFVRSARYLEEEGFSKEQIKYVLSAMSRVVQGMRAEGGAVEMDPKLRAFFENRAGLNGAQIETVHMLSLEIAGER
ncbi:MAG: M56 family metallopeptidase [Acidobacteriota bacterium]|nr:M56 family metallopeptidase [Acidobacteriota bacterium]